MTGGKRVREETSKHQTHIRVYKNKQISPKTTFIHTIVMPAAHTSNYNQHHQQIKSKHTKCKPLNFFESSNLRERLGLKTTRTNKTCTTNKQANLRAQSNTKRLFSFSFSLWYKNIVLLSAIDTGKRRKIKR